MNCDLCNQPVLPGQPRRGGHGDGGKSGAPLGFERHWNCHTAKFGKTPTDSFAAIRKTIDDAFGRPAKPQPPRKPVLAPKVLKGPYNGSPNAAREFTMHSFISEMGKRRGKIDCPFCNTTFTAFVWSLSGGGKKCPGCGALHTGRGTAHPIEGNEELGQ